MYGSVAYIILVLFAFVSLTLIFYYLYFFLRLALYKPSSQNSELPPCSIIICARNEQYHLEANIPIILQQKYENDQEVLLVNDNSEDDTKHIMQWMSRNHSHVRSIHIDRKSKESLGKKYPLSIGIREAKYEHLLLTDADCVPASTTWAAKMQAAYRPGIDIVLGYGAYEKHRGLLNKIIRFETFHTALQYLSYALAGHAYMGVGRNLSYKKTVFNAHKGFTSINHIPGGDDDLFISKAATRSNTAIMIDADSHTISTPKKTWKDWKHQKTRHYSTSKYYKPKHKFLLGLYSLSQFLFYPLFLASVFFYNWQISILFLCIKSIIQYIIFSKALKKLNESDLIKWIFVMDIWMIFYYLLFAHTLWIKEKKTW